MNNYAILFIHVLLYLCGIVTENNQDMFKSVSDQENITVVTTNNYYIFESSSNGENTIAVQYKPVSS